MFVFTPNTLIKSSEVNANFDDHETQINTLNSRVNAMDAIRVYFDNGTGTRSSTTSASLATLPGATGDTSYTAPIDVDIIFTMTMMMNITSGAGGGRVYLRINTTNRTQGLYFDSTGGGWQIQSIQYPKYSVNAGQTITIGAQWATSSGTFTITNNSTDEQYPNEIVGLIIPRS